MSLRDELKKLTPEMFDTLGAEKRKELIDYNNEHVREWRGTCRACGMKLKGTLASIREHSCGTR